MDQLGGGHLLVTVDKDQLAKLSPYRWHADYQKNTIYAVAWVPGQKTKIAMHRLLLRLQKGDPREVDHINHNGLDNRMTNLRIVTKRQNQYNQTGRRKRHDGKKITSSYPGVSWHRLHRKWQTVIKCGGKLMYLGIFDDERDAATAYRKAKNVRDAGGTPQEIKASTKTGANTND